MPGRQRKLRRRCRIIKGHFLPPASLDKRRGYPPCGALVPGLGEIGKRVDRTDQPAAGSRSSARIARSDPDAVEHPGLGRSHDRVKGAHPFARKRVDRRDRHGASAFALAGSTERSPWQATLSNSAAQRKQPHFDHRLRARALLPRSFRAVERAMSAFADEPPRLQMRLPQGHGGGRARVSGRAGEIGRMRGS